MKYITEQQVLNAVGIQDWRHLSRDKILRFVAMMPDMDKDLALKLIDKLPDFVDLAKAALEYLGEGLKSIDSSNSENQRAINEIAKTLSTALEGMLQNPDNSPEEKKYIVEKLFELYDRVSVNDKENKHFLIELADKYQLSSVMIVAAAIIFIGGKVYLKR